MTLVGLLGEGITTSLTPPMHRRESSRLGLDYEYRIIDTAISRRPMAELPRIIAEVADEGYDALNVTHPFKQRIIPYLDELTPDAAELGAVNLVVYTDGRTTGHNTDWTGFSFALREGLGSVRGDRVLQVGAGGAGAATSFALLRSGVAALAIIDRDDQQANLLAARLNDLFPGTDVLVISMGEFDRAIRGVDGVVHATPTGMLHNPGLPFSLDAVPRDAWVSDVVYLPLETALVRGARERGHRVLDGGLMAVGQAVDSIRIITGREPDASRMRADFLQLVEEEMAP
ncbi:shikimate dehydrogenase [Microbacterium sp. NPDC078428]|uniref:shikimate dehydrogenase n=1 Tax=Microbacterium sp. NPDC078428 TaxID=3364190 RepID=UPI0037C8F7E0